MTTMESAIVSKLAEHGVLGIVTLICLYTIWKLSNDLTAERTGRREDAQKHAEVLRGLQDARLADAGNYTSKLLEINTKVHATVDKLADVADHISKRRKNTDVA